MIHCLTRGTYNKQEPGNQDTSLRDFNLCPQHANSGLGSLPVVVLLIISFKQSDKLL